MTKRVANDVPLFRNRVNMRSTSLPSSYPEVVTMSALTEANRQLVAALAGIDVKEASKFNAAVKDHLRHITHLDPSEALVSCPGRNC